MRLQQSGARGVTRATLTAFSFVYFVYFVVVKMNDSPPSLSAFNEKSLVEAAPGGVLLRRSFLTAIVNLIDAEGINDKAGWQRFQSERFEWVERIL